MPSAQAAVPEGDLHKYGSTGNSDTKKRKSSWISIAITATIMLVTMIIAGIFKEQISQFGVELIARYGRYWVDGILFLLTAFSCTPLMLPVWIYALAGVSLGYNVFRLAAVMALGSALGSFATFGLGRFFGNTRWVKRNFPKLLNHPWTEGKSKKRVSWILFLGTASPIPCDAIYAACGFKRYPGVPFLIIMIGGRLARYMYLGYLYHYFGEYF
ncbi:MAG: DedA family protein [Candidatus Zixiibacteriota bacterium]|nr:MAG: DedA family protein [candidate division Zixibacteria bacterium]